MITAVHSLLGIALCLVMWLLWKRAVMEAFRQSVFAKRNRLFELALENKEALPFYSETYQKMWAKCNGLIRFGFVLNMSYILIASITMRIKRIDDRPAREVLRESSRVNFEGLPGSVKKELVGIERALNIAVFKYLMTTSPLFFVYTCSALIVLISTTLSIHVGKKLKKASAPIISSIMDQAMDEGLACAA